MQRVGVWALGLGLVIIVGLLTTEQGYAEEKEHAPTCTLATLKGRYLFGGIATLGGQPLVVAGYHIFNGDGTGIDVVTSRINDILVDENSVHEISYTVNPDCSGTYTVLSVPLSFGLFVAPNGEELIVIGMDPGTALVQGPNRRVSHK